MLTQEIPDKLFSPALRPDVEKLFRLLERHEFKFKVFKSNIHNHSAMNGYLADITEAQENLSKAELDFSKKHSQSLTEEQRDFLVRFFPSL